MKLPEPDGFSSFHAIFEFEDGCGSKDPTATASSLVLNSLHASVIAIIHLKWKLKSHFFISLKNVM